MNELEPALVCMGRDVLSIVLQSVHLEHSISVQTPGKSVRVRMW